MHTYDLIMIMVLATAVLFGFWKGLAWQIASLSSIFASYFVAYQFRQPLAQMLNASPPWNMFLAMLILYLATSLAIWLAFRFVSEFINQVKLKEFDSHTGAVLGGLRGVLWCVIITLFAVTLTNEAQQQKIIESRSGHYIAVLLDRSHAIMPEEVHQIIGPYIHSLDERLEGEQHYAHQHDETGTAGERNPEAESRGLLSLPGTNSTAEGATDGNELVVDRWLENLQDLRVGRRN